MPEVTEEEVLAMLEEFRDRLNWLTGAAYIFESLTGQIREGAVSGQTEAPFQQAYFLALDEIRYHSQQLPELARCISKFYLKRIGVRMV